MRNMILTIIATAAFATFGMSESESRDYPFCLKAEAGPGDCRYDTLAQCQAAVSGIKGYCQANYAIAPTTFARMPYYPSRGYQTMR